MPVSHAYVRNAEEQEYFPAALGQCQVCGLVQMLHPVPMEKLVPPFDWIRYNEPERHLDSLVERVCSLPGLSTASVIAGLGPNDDSTLSRFRDRGFVNTWRPDTAADLEINGANAGTAIIQACVNEALGRKLRLIHGAADVLVARMLLEHTYSPASFLRGIKSLLAPSGYVVLEVPDSKNALEVLDYTVIWEEHVLYFTPATLRETLRRHGLIVRDLLVYPSGHNDSLVAIAQTPSAGESTGVATISTACETVRMRAFAEALPQCRQIACDRLKAWRQRGDVALLGAGHDSVVFVSLMGIAELLSVVLDDHPAKAGFCLPGSSLPIRDSSALHGDRLPLCLLGAGSGNETRIMSKHRAFESAGGTFASIYPQSPRYLLGMALPALHRKLMGSRPDDPSENS